MADNLYIVILTALLPVTACILVFQVNPYYALIIRGILGEVAALVYVLFGAAEVALTEAFVGTMLAITLYAIAVRSSLRMRLGVLENHLEKTTDEGESLLSALRQMLNKYHMRLEVVTYGNSQELNSALETKDVHTICISPREDADSFYHLHTRIQRLYHIMQSDLPENIATLSYTEPTQISEEKIIDQVGQK